LRIRRSRRFANLNWLHRSALDELARTSSGENPMIETSQGLVTLEAPVRHGQHGDESKPNSGFLAWLRRAVPTALVLAALGGLAVLGHATGWKLPKFSELNGTAKAGKDDWCPEHGVAESTCVECNPGLLPRGKEYGFCAVHGIAECSLDHPDVAQLKVLPEVTATDRDRAAQAIKSGRWPANDVKCKKHHRRLQFASVEAAKKAGVRAEMADVDWMVECVAGNGEIGYDQTRVARLSSRVPGTVWRVEKQVGDAVTQGEVLALVDAGEVGKAKAEFRQAFTQVDVKRQILENLRSAGAAVPARSLQDADAAFREARIRMLSAQQALVNLGLPIRAESLKGLTDEQIVQRMQFLGLSDALASSLGPKTASDNLLPIKSPMSGIIVSRETAANVGVVVGATDVLFVVADTKKMWVDLHVSQEDARRLKLNQPVHFRPDGFGIPASYSWYEVSQGKLVWKNTVMGNVTWISTAADEKTRTVTVRAELDNAEGLLRASSFGTGRIVVREEQTVLVGKDALQHEGCCNIVFVRDKNFNSPDAPTVFHVRKVVPGASDAKSVEIIAGVLPGEYVVLQGAGLLRAELLKNDLGAG